MPGLFAASERRAGSLLSFITLVKQSSSMPIGDATRLRNVFNVGFGSKREELSVSKSRPLYPAKRTLARRAATSPMGQNRTHGTMHMRRA
jgi:hypothetical protein